LLYYSKSSDFVKRRNIELFCFKGIILASVIRK
jgi:hypothetical protein